MFFNLKYHIASLVAVFLALGLGILIGSAVPGGDALVSQQQQLTRTLEIQLDTLRKKNQFLEARVISLEMNNNIQRQFESRVLPVLVAGRLKGRSIAIIETAGRRFADDLAGILKAAGAEIQSTTALSGLQIRDRKGLLEKLNWPDTDEKTLTSRLAGEIAGAVLTGNTGTLGVLEAGRIIRTGGRYGGPLDDVVIVGGSPDKGLVKIDAVDFTIIDFFKSRGINVYGVEESCAAYSYMKDYQKKGITTVDNIDTVPGQVSLVYAISGSPGQYGVKSSARMLLPAMDSGVRANDR